jgi:hypothetical protein
MGNNNSVPVNNQAELGKPTMPAMPKPEDSPVSPTDTLGWGNYNNYTENLNNQLIDLGNIDNITDTESSIDYSNLFLNNTLDTNNQTNIAQPNANSIANIMQGGNIDTPYRLEDIDTPDTNDIFNQSVVHEYGDSSDMATPPAAVESSDAADAADAADTADSSTSDADVPEGEVSTTSDDVVKKEDGVSSITESPAESDEPVKENDAAGYGFSETSVDMEEYGNHSDHEDKITSSSINTEDLDFIFERNGRN